MLETCTAGRQHPDAGAGVSASPDSPIKLFPRPTGGGNILYTQGEGSGTAAPCSLHPHPAGCEAAKQTSLLPTQHIFHEQKMNAETILFTNSS